MVLKPVFLPAFRAPSSYCPTDMAKMASLSLSCTSPYEIYDESSELENEIAEILPTFDSAERDWNSFGYLLNEATVQSTSGSKSDSETSSCVFKKPLPVEPIGKGRRRRAAKPKAEVKKEVINPADITLGGDTYDYAKSEQKPTETIASGVARRRRTSANLSKSEEDQEKPESSSKPPTTRGKKERRTSEPSRVIFYSPGAIIDIDAGIAHCICQKMFDAAKFYVQCDMCARWYHGDCVDMNERKAIQMEHWTCSQCIEEQEKVKERPALYCVCRKPYDDTKFYVGCDSCQGWFHPECVGTTREESEQAAEYNCPECIRRGYESEASDASVSSRVSVQLSRADYAHVLELLELLVEHRMSTPFRKPVDLSEFPDYEQYIKKPMDLSIINHKVECTEYLYLSEFVNDVNLMFENAKTYNPKDHAVFKCAETMQEVFDKKLIEIREKMALRQQQLLLQQHHGDLMSSARKRVQSESQKTVDSLDIDPDQLLPLDDKIMGLFFQ